VRAARRLLPAAFALTVAAACASGGGGDRVLTADEQYARAVARFEDGDYAEAITDLQAFAFNYPQDPRVMDARWLMARSYLESEDWATAAQELLNFQRDFPREGRAADALFQAGVAYQRMSLRPELDQRDTERAINVYDRVLREYPASDVAAEARERRSQLRSKLAEKAYLNGEFYFENEAYEAAETYLFDLIATYPDTPWIAPAYALLARTYCAWGQTSRAVEMGNVLREQFSDTSAAREVDARLEPACRATTGGAARGASAPVG
jgi:outer membrane protein assembly factor BamD